MKLVPVTEFKWPSWDDIGPLFTMTCKNHDFLRWSTKHPMYRNIHYLGPVETYTAEDFKEGRAPKEHLQFMWKECDCKWNDMLVIEEETEQ